jgi:glutamine amidotransferase
MSIAIIDYGMGNLRSVEKALQHVGASSAFITNDPAKIATADKAVLPGDGAFDATMLSLRESGIDQVVKDFAASGKPLLGICIGMQVFMTSSEEGDPGVIGLELIPGIVKRFPTTDHHGEKISVPQIGWNRLKVRSSSLLKGLPAESWVYCLHSYYCEPYQASVISGDIHYGLDYCAVAESGNVYATQFHPEKSGDAGLHILTNFVNL